MKEYNAHSGERRTLRDVLFLLGVAIALGFGLALASPVFGATLGQNADGDIGGTITVARGSAAGIAVELHQRANNGADTLLASTTTDESGVYHFTKQSSAPNDAYYQVKVTGGAGMLAVWYSFPIIYLAGQNFSVPSIEMADVALILPKDGEQIALPNKLAWQARRSGETFRVYIYDAANLGKALLDSGSLGMNTEYALPEGALAPGNYEAVVQVRDAVVGYGVSQAHFRFSIVTAAGGASTGEATPEVSGGEGSPEAETPAEPTAPVEAPVGQPELELHLTADKTEVRQGETLTFRVEVSNKGSVIAPDVVVTDKLPVGATVDAAAAKSSTGSVTVEDNNVTAQVGDLASGDKVVVEIPVTVGTDATSNVSNQASASYRGAANPALSNAYVAQVAGTASTLEGPAEQPTSAAQPATETPPTAAPEAPTSPAQAPTTVAASEPPVATEQAPEPTKAVAPTPRPKPTQATAGGGAAQEPKAPIPQTGGSFPLVFAVLLLAATLAARYLRGYLRSRNGRRT
jgi:uncharacterized repeat protein (TIGR01451 family)